MDVLQSWFILAFATPIIWAIICLFDSCFVGDKIYRSTWDGPVISGLFSAVPLLIWALMAPETITDSTSLSAALSTLTPEQLVNAYGAACLAALMYFLHIYFYFRALFRLNDVANTESVMALSVVIVPIFAWFLLGERLSGAFYAAVILAFIGLLVTGWSTLRRIYVNASLAADNEQKDNIMQRRANCIDVSVSLLLAVVCISLSLVLQAKALESLSFSGVTISFSATMLILSIVVLSVSANYRRQLGKILQRYYPMFIGVEGLEVLARLAGQRAIEIGPSVTAVALVQSTLPILIIIFSLMLIGTDRIRSFLSPALRQTLALQSESIQTKTTLLVVTVAAVLILQQGGSF